MCQRRSAGQPLLYLGRNDTQAILVDTVTTPPLSSDRRPSTRVASPLEYGSPRLPCHARQCESITPPWPCRRQRVAEPRFSQPSRRAQSRHCDAKIATVAGTVRWLSTKGRGHDSDAKIWVADLDPPRD